MVLKWNVTRKEIEFEFQNQNTKYGKHKCSFYFLTIYQLKSVNVYKLLINCLIKQWSDMTIFKNKFFIC